MATLGGRYLAQLIINNEFIICFGPRNSRARTVLCEKIDVWRWLVEMISVHAILQFSQGCYRAYSPPVWFNARRFDAFLVE